MKPGKEMRRFRYDATSLDDITVSSLSTFIQSFKQGSIKPDLRSAPEPEQGNDSFTLVGSSWNRVVKDTSKDVFVFYYAPYC